MKLLAKASRYYPRAFNEWIYRSETNERIEEYFNRIGYGFLSTPDTIEEEALKAFNQRETTLLKDQSKSFLSDIATDLMDDMPF